MIPPGISRSMCRIFLSGPSSTVIVARIFGIFRSLPEFGRIEQQKSCEEFFLNFLIHSKDIVSDLRNPQNTSVERYTVPSAGESMNGFSSDYFYSEMV